MVTFRFKGVLKKDFMNNFVKVFAVSILLTKTALAIPISYSYETLVDLNIPVLNLAGNEKITFNFTIDESDYVGLINGSTNRKSAYYRYYDGSVTLPDQSYSSDVELRGTNPLEGYVKKDYLANDPQRHTYDEFHIVWQTFRHQLLPDRNADLVFMSAKFRDYDKNFLDSFALPDFNFFTKIDEVILDYTISYGGGGLTRKQFISKGKNGVFDEEHTLTVNGKVFTTVNEPTQLFLILFSLLFLGLRFKQKGPTKWQNKPRWIMC
jgi:hypothetical protein